jgi:hypothetical protein
MRHVLAAVLALATATAWAGSVPVLPPGEVTPAAAPAPSRPVSEAPQKSPAAPAPAPSAPAAPSESAAAKETGEPAQRPPVGIEDLKALYKESSLIVEFQAESVLAKADVATRPIWEVRGPVMEVIKGSLLPGQISVHVDSVLRTFDLPRNEIPGKTFLAAIKPLTDGADRRFLLAAAYAFPADGAEAQALRQLAQADSGRGAGGLSLELVVRPTEKAFAPNGRKVVEVRLTNTGEDSATYLQAPIMERDGKLYVSGQGLLRIRDITGRIVPDKGNVVIGQPPLPPTPALILPKASFVEIVDLGKYFDLPEGRYTLSIALASPDGRTRVASNGFIFQVGAVNLPEPAAGKTPFGEAVPPPLKGPAEKPPAETSITEKLPAVPPPKPKPTGPDIPDPNKYQPGKQMAGLAALLKPSRPRYALGDAVDLEFRIINQAQRAVAIDGRLERTLTIQVQAVADSPQPLVIRQVIPWPSDGGAMPEERALLREGAFWGRTINLNTLYGKSLEEFPAPTPEEIAAGKGITYERFGKNLFGFPKPGVYTVTATYSVIRPKQVESQPHVEPAREWWIGELQTNPVTIQILEQGQK